MSAIDTLRSTLVRKDFNNTYGKLPESAKDRGVIRALDLADTALFGANAAASGTAAALYVGVPTMAYGAAKTVFGLHATCGFCSTDANPGMRIAKSGLTILASGAATCLLPHGARELNILLAAWSSAKAIAVHHTPVTEAHRGYHS